MSNKPEGKENQQEAEVKGDNEDSIKDSPEARTLPPFPSEHVPTLIIKDGSLIMNVKDQLTFIGQVGGFFVYQHPSPSFKLRRLAVTAKVVGISEPIFQNVKPVSQVQIWLQPNVVTPHVTLDNRSDRLNITVDQPLAVLGPTMDPDLEELRFIHTHPGFGGSAFKIERVLILDEQNRPRFQNFEARDYNIIFFKQHDLLTVVKQTSKL